MLHSKMDPSDKKSPVDANMFEELSRLNNELADLQRELIKKNRELEKANAEKALLLQVDELTNLWNRRHFYERFNELCSLSQRHSRPLTMVMFDLDNFKSLNDTYGHQFGDAVLKCFAVILKKYCRVEDVPARLGGEEFAMILPETNIDAAFTTVERIRRHFSQRDVLGNRTTCTVSVGIAQLTTSDTYDTIMNKADKALYVSKNSGRNKTSICE